MSAPSKHTVVLPPPYSGIHKNGNEMYKHFYEYWKRTGGYKSSVTDLKGLEASVKELNTLVGVRTDESVQEQIDLKANSADLGTMSTQDSDAVTITGGTITNASISESNIQIPGGTSGLSLQLGATLHTDTSEVGNVGLGEDTLITFNMAENVLAVNGQYLEITAWGTIAANANNKRIKFKLGSTTLLDTTAVAANAGSWMIDVKIIRTASSAEQCISKIISDNALIVDSANYISAVEDTTGTLNIFCTGEAVANDDIIQKGLIIKWFNN
jgi:hypothetical protein